MVTYFLQNKLHDLAYKICLIKSHLHLFIPSILISQWTDKLIYVSAKLISFSTIATHFQQNSSFVDDVPSIQISISYSCYPTPFLLPFVCYHLLPFSSQLKYNINPPEGLTTHLEVKCLFFYNHITYYHITITIILMCLRGALFFLTLYLLTHRT